MEQASKECRTIDRPAGTAGPAQGRRVLHHYWPGRSEFAQVCEGNSNPNVPKLQGCDLVEGINGNLNGSSLVPSVGKKLLDMSWLLRTVVVSEDLM